jgi:hypothetical protein
MNEQIKEKKLNENSKVEEIEATSAKYEEVIKKEREEKDTNIKAYLIEKQKRIDLEEEINRLKEKLEEKKLEELRQRRIEQGRKETEEGNIFLDILKEKLDKKLI